MVRLKCARLLSHLCLVFTNDSYSFPKWQFLDASKQFADDKFEIDENGLKFSENAVGKGKIARNEQFFLFPQSFQDFCCRNIKTRACLGKS